MSISAESVTRTVAWRTEIRWWTGFPKTEIIVIPCFTARLRLSYIVQFAGEDRKTTVELRTMREAVTKKAVTHVLRRSFPGLAQNLRPGALRHLRRVLRGEMDTALSPALDRLEAAVNER